jgi:hypothetical protein
VLVRSEHCHAVRRVLSPGQVVSTASARARAAGREDPGEPNGRCFEALVEFEAALLAALAYWNAHRHPYRRRR